MTGTTRRLFFALWPNDAVRDALRQWQKRCLPENARPTHHDDLHMTVHFLGQVESGRMAELEVLGANTVGRTFDLRLHRLGHFARPRVLWAGVKGIPDALLELHEDLGEGLRDLGFALDTRPFKPHVTLARKVREKQDIVDLKEINWHVTRWALVESRSGRVPLYEPLVIWSLGEK